MSLLFPKFSQKELAKLALENHLYVDAWNMQIQYDSILDLKKSSIRVVLAFQQGVPVGSCTVNIESRLISVFTKNGYRGKGLGKKMIQQILKESNLSVNEVYAGLGEEGSETFFTKNKILSLKEAGTPLTKEETEKFIKGECTYESLLINYLQTEHIKQFNCT